MRDSVRAAFLNFTTPLEGYCAWPYLDVLGLVTTGVGNLIDPIETAIGLPWTIMGLRPASPDEIREGWNAVKARKDLAPKGGAIFRDVSQLRLTEAAITDLVNARLETDETILRERFPAWDDFCADAQLGILSMAWAMGPAFHFPKFVVDCNDTPPNWCQASIDCHIANGSFARNAANRVLFQNAAIVDAEEMNPELLAWPARLA